jgi:excisionase family DNA binding protein
MPTTEFFNVREAAKQLNIHENTVRNLEKRGELKAVRLPGSGFRRFRKEDIERMRHEMWSQFAPDTAMPTQTRRPTRRHTLTDEDYAA